MCLLRIDRHTHTRISVGMACIWEVHRHIIHHDMKVLCENGNMCKWIDFVCKSMLVRINHLGASSVYRMWCIYTWRNRVFIFSVRRTHSHLCNVVALRLRKLSLSRSPSPALSLWLSSLLRSRSIEVIRRGQCVRKNTHINLANAIAMEHVYDFVPGEYFSHLIISVKFEFDRWLEKREIILYSETTTSFESTNSILPNRHDYLF